MTRAKKMLIIIGNPDVIKFMIQNNNTRKRNTGLEEKLLNGELQEKRKIIFLEKILESIYPTKCAICGKFNENGICKKCNNILNNRELKRIYPNRLKEIYFDYSTKLLSILTIVIYTLVGALVYFFVTSRFKLLQSILGDDYIKKIKSKFRR